MAQRKKPQQTSDHSDVETPAPALRPRAAKDLAPANGRSPQIDALGSTGQAKGRGATSEPPDQAERNRIINELDTTMMVEAAAGTGKTTSMVRRMIALLREGKCRIDTVAAVTFTRKAAAELRDRFQLELERQVRAAEGVARQRLTDALAHIERCFIGTIHSFCARLLRERPVEAGVDLSFVEIEPEIDEQLRRQAWDEHVATFFATDDPVLKELDTLGLPINQLSEAFLKYAEYPDVQEWPATPVELPDLHFAIAALGQYAAHMQRLAPTFPRERGDDQLMRQYERLPLMVRQADLAQPRELLEIMEEFRNQKVVQKHWPGGQRQGKQEKEKWEAFRDDVANPLVRAWFERRYEVVLRVLQSAAQVYDRLREKAGALNYQDLLLKSAALLRNQPKIREYFRARFTHLLVDEFQDTDPIQAEVILLLTADDSTQTDWQKCRPVPGSLFVVGDPKQSIYRFRRADIVTYSSVKAIIEKHGAIVPLSANFRGIEPMIAWVNRAFEKSFPAEQTDYSPAGCPLQVGRGSGNDGQLAGLHVLRIPEEHQNTPAAVDYEADLVARFIRKALDAGLTVPRTPKDLEHGVRPAVSPGDFLILARRKKNLTRYAQKLDALGVPNQVAGGSGLQEIEELRLLHTCLSVLMEPDNPVALVAALRSELFGVSDIALYAFKRAGGRFAFHARMPSELATDDRVPLEDAFDRLTQYDRWLKRLPLPSAVERIVADLGLPARAAARPGGNVQAGSLAKALEVLRAAHAQLHSAAELVEFLREVIEEGMDCEGAPARVPDEPAVRIMNLHKAKGLEAPIVFLVDPTGEKKHDVEVHIDRAGGPVRGYMAVLGPLKGFQRDLLAHPREWEDHQGREKQFLDAENNRLLYVAATRAGACLVITQRRGKDAYRNPWRFFEPHLEDVPIVEDPGSTRPPVRSAVTVPAVAVEEAKRVIDERWATVLRKTYAVTAAKKVSVREAPLPPSPVEPADELPEGEHGTEWGTVIHLLLETAIREPAADLKKLAYDKLGEEGLEGKDREQLADRAVEAVEQVKRSAVWQRAQACEQRLVEVPFETLWPVDGAVPTVVRGVIDLIFREPQGWVIVDYKTHRRSMKELVEEYGGQVRLYADIWECIVGQPVHETGLYSTHLDQYEAIPSTT